MGVLDLIIKLPGVPLIFAEGKIIKGNLFGPTPAQFAEGEKWKKAGVDAIADRLAGQMAYVYFALDQAGRQA